MEHGFIKKKDVENKNLITTKEQSLKVPIRSNKTCKYCENLQIDYEVEQIFGIYTCKDCK